MRNPKRINKIVVLLEKAWGLVPDWRLGQLVSNLLGPGPQDIFFPEDEEWEEMLNKFIQENDKTRNNKG